jgi:hypothetical protein
MRGKKAKAQRKIRNANVAQLERAVNHNYMMAAALREGVSQILTLYFWQQVAIAALCEYVKQRGEPGAFADLEKAVYYWPAKVMI